MDLVIGRIYRRSAIHAEFNGQKQGGISTPANFPVVLVFTGESGHQHGYRDGFQPDGVFFYTGEGQLGDQTMSGGNRAIAQAAERGKSIHIFEAAQRSHVRYMGEARCIGHHFSRGPDREGVDRQLIVFELELGIGVPQVIDAPDLRVPDPQKSGNRSLADLRARALTGGEPSQSSSTDRKTRVYERSKNVREYVLARADGICEACETAAPFKRKDGSPYLEPHHIVRMADGGPDHIAFVAAICPTCHRRIHHGEDGHALNQLIGARISALEENSL